MPPREAARVRAGLRALVRRYGDGAKVAAAIGVSPTAVNACLRRDTGPSDALASAVASGLGMRSKSLLLEATCEQIDAIQWIGHAWRGVLPGDDRLQTWREAGLS